MFVAYRGYSVILFAPVAALGVLLTDPARCRRSSPACSWTRWSASSSCTFPVFLLGAVFGKVIELSGFSKSIVAAAIGLVGRERAMLSIVLVCALLTYGGVSLFVVVFAVYPFAAEMFRQSNIPKRLIPGTIALGAFTFTMDSLPGTPQIQNIIPTTFFKTNTWAAPMLGTIGALFILVVGLAYLEWRRRQAARGWRRLWRGPHQRARRRSTTRSWRIRLIAILPLVLVGVLNKVFTGADPRVYGDQRLWSTRAGTARKPLGRPRCAKVAAIWAVEGALLVGILTRAGLRVAAGRASASPKAARRRSAARCWRR